MTIKIKTIKKRTEFIKIKSSGKILTSNSMIIQKLFDKDLNNSIKIGYTATKSLGNAVKRNRAKRLMRVLVREVMEEYGKVNFSYVLIAKNSIFNKSIDKLKEELIKLLKKNEKNN